MEGLSWPSAAELNDAKKKVAKMSGRDVGDVRAVVSPYRICPLGAHIDHQGGIVSAMTINKGIILAFVPSCDAEVVLRSGQFDGHVKFRVDEKQCPRSSKPLQETNSGWECYARGALYALQNKGNQINKVGIAYLLALESANNLSMSHPENIELDRLIENEYLGIQNGILDQSAVLLSKYGHLMIMDCKKKRHSVVSYSILNNGKDSKVAKVLKILLAFSGIKHSLKDNPGYNCRVAECKEAAELLLRASGAENVEPRLCEVESRIYEEHKHLLESNLAKRAAHYFSESKRVNEGIEAWSAGNLVEFGKLISASGLSSIQNYECGCEPMIQLYEILLRAPGVFGARFSGAGFRGCCLAFVDPNQANEAASFVQKEYSKAQPELASQVPGGSVVLICNAGDFARVL